MNRIDVSKILPEQYFNILCGFKKAFSGSIYLYGGWLLSTICRKPYFGDIDIAIDADKYDIIRTLRKFGIRYEINLHNSIRVRISDGNSIDINPLSDEMERLSIEEFLSRKTFTVHECAIEINDNFITSTERFRTDMSKQQFGISPRANLSDQRPLSVLRSWHALKNFYALSFYSSSADQLDQLTSMSSVWPCSQNSKKGDTLSALKHIIEPYLPTGHQTYIAKGAIRSSLLNSFDIWDDVDIVIVADFDTIITHLERVEASYTLNYYGNPKIFLPQGQSVDIIPLSSFEKIHETLKGFFHSCDRLLWCWEQGEIYDPQNVLRDVIGRAIITPEDISISYSEEDLAYYSLKSVYLIVRHNMKADEFMIQYINSPQLFTSHHQRLTVSMLQELLSLFHPSELGAAFRDLNAGMPSSAVTNFLNYFNVVYPSRFE